jgi:hypothetical protein
MPIVLRKRNGVKIRQIREGVLSARARFLRIREQPRPLILNRRNADTPATLNIEANTLFPGLGCGNTAALCIYRRCGNTNFCN